jgi:hypothetical protein
MAINSSTVVVGVSPRISPAKFTEILRDHGSPATMSAEVGYAAVEQQGVDPAFALAIFHQESQFGIDGVCKDFATLSPGNTRSTRTGIGQVIDTPFGPFVRYPSWTDGWRDLAFRLVDPLFFYALQQRRTIRPILELWAPPNDIFDINGLNNTDIYVNHVVQHIIDWSDVPGGGQPTPTGGPECSPVPPPPFDGTDKQVGDVIFHATAQTVEVAADGLPCQQFAFQGSCETREPLQSGDTFEALYWVEGEAVDGERRWWVAKSGSRIWSGGTMQKPGATD